jgi:translocation and assembly module TamA
VSVGTNIEQENILQEGVRRYYTLFSIPLGAKFDSTGLSNPLQDPQHGLRMSLSVAPTEALGAGRAAAELPLAPSQTPSTSSQCVDNTSASNEAPSTGHANFLIIQGTVSTYFDLSRSSADRPGRTILALRALAGLAQGASQFSLPPDQRFYGGGSATVRGYRYQSVGPVFADCNPKGGTAIEAMGAELRQRIGRDFGAALFVDAGQVWADARPFESGLQVGYGGGVRYYTPIGAIRFDVALPTHRPAGGDALEVYVGLGQTF